MKKLLPLLVGTLLASACTDQVTPTASAPARPFGFTGSSFVAPVGTYWKANNLLWVYDMTPEVGVGTHAGTDVRFQQARAMGVRLVRHTLYWDTRYPDALAGAVAAAQRNNVELVVVVHNVGQCREHYADPYGTFATFMADQARRYPSVRFWELFNEQDAPGWTNWFGGVVNGCSAGAATTEQQGYEYAQMLKRVYPAIKSANSGAYVLVGGLTGHNGWDFIRGIYRGGGKPYFDFMNIHTYGASPDEPVRGRGQGVASLMASYGDAGRPLWNTEFGTGAVQYVVAWNTPHANGKEDGPEYDAYQRGWWTEALDIHQNNRIYQKMLGYQLDGTDGGPPAAGCRPGLCWDNSILPAGRVGEDYGFGLLRANGTEPRPTYTYLQARDFNQNVQVNTRYQDVRVHSPTRNPAAFGWYRDGEYVVIRGVPVNSLTPTGIPFQSAP